MARDVLSVGQINEYIRSRMDSDPNLTGLAIRGEISNYKVYPSGHHYFTLKDETAALKCVMFRGSAMGLKFRPENGMKIVAMGRITVFPRDGAYQLYCTGMIPDGVGDLYIAFEQLKKKLQEKGLFDPAHKKPLPKYPKCICIITSEAGAAVHDMLRILRKRYPLTRVRLLPVRVQGAEAPGEIASAIRYANYYRLGDLLIVGRGGGSIEDLWAFNGERLARRIYSAEIPIISAVGHETDFTICDFVADMRAPTPSAAAELATPDIRELALRADNLFERAQNAALSRLSYESERLKRMRDSSVLSSAHGFIDGRRGEVERLSSESLFVMNAVLQKARSRLSVCAEKAVAMNPLAVLARGYSVTEKDGKILGSADSVSVGDDLKIRLHEGEISARVVSVSRESDNP